jgi:oligopeptide/dipeptide ABC transporter ATP-binding protein
MKLTSETNALYRVEGLCIEPVANPQRELLIEDFSLRVKTGQIVGIVGETGAGKSLSMMASVGLLPLGVHAVAGLVSFNGSEQVLVTRSKDLRTNLGHGVSLLFQNAKGALNPFMRVKAQLNRVLSLRGVSGKSGLEYCHNILNSVGLAPDEILPKYAHQMSGGQAQRVALAIALATEPMLLIADEPTTALDVTTQREVINLLRRLCRERNMGLILITHNLALVSQTCDYVVLLHAGHIVERGPVEKIFSEPQHPYTVGLMKAIPDVDQPRDLVPLIGNVPSLGNLGVGCRFSSRCPHVWERCCESVPSFYFSDDSEVRCFLFETMPSD